MWGQGVVVVWMTTGYVCVLGKPGTGNSLLARKAMEVGVEARVFFLLGRI